jgi:hypothetical protein
METVGKIKYLSSETKGKGAREIFRKFLDTTSDEMKIVVKCETIFLLMSRCKQDEDF